MLELKDRLYYIGVQDHDLRVFDIIMHTPYGTSYNAYLLRGSQKSALVETVKVGFCEEYFRKIEEIMPIEQIDYLIINHTEPDHAGTIPKLLEKNPNLTIIGANSAITFVEYIINHPFKSRVVKKGDTLDLGDRQLQFFPLPNLHWPDTMYTWDPVSKALFTCDSFGSHFGFDGVLLSRLEDKTEYWKSLKFYFDDILSPFIVPFMQNGLSTARQLGPDIIATGHGPVIDSQIDEVFARYEQWCTLPPKAEGKTVAVVYVSAYGYTQLLAQTMARALQDAGVNAVLLDAVTQPQDEILKQLVISDGMLFGSPTILGCELKPISDLLGAMYPFQFKNKLASAFGSYGWSGEAVPNIIAKLALKKAKTVEGFKARLQPNQEELKQAEEFAKAFAQAL